MQAANSSPRGGFGNCPLVGPENRSDREGRNGPHPRPLAPKAVFGEPSCPILTTIFVSTRSRPPARRVPCRRDRQSASSEPSRASIISCPGRRRSRPISIIRMSFARLGAWSGRSWGPVDRWETCDALPRSMSRFAHVPTTTGKKPDGRRAAPASSGTGPSARLPLTTWSGRQRRLLQFCAAVR